MLAFHLSQEKVQQLTEDQEKDNMEEFLKD